MNEARKLWLARAAHTLIYAVMASSALAMLFAGITGARGIWLWLASGLVTIEVAVFVGSGLKCPLTAVVARHAAGREGISDTFLPKRLTRHTATVFGPIVAVAVALIAWRTLRS